MNQKKVLDGFYEIISEHKIELFDRDKAFGSLRSIDI